MQISVEAKWSDLHLGSARPDLGLERPYLGSEKPALGSDLGSEGCFVA